MKRVHIFDLDHTTIDSSHRVNPCLDKDGNLNLQQYIDEACKPELIERDRLLPLATYMQQLIEAGEKVVICTARYMNNADYVYLRKNKLRVPLILSRDQLKNHFPVQRAAQISKMSDAKYKGHYFDMLKGRFPDAQQFIMYDDHQGVLAAAHDRGFYTVDAIVMNQMLNESFGAGYECAEEQIESEIVSLVDDALVVGMLGA